MITVKVELEAIGVVGKDCHYEKDSFVTDINLSLKEAQKYYAIGKVFNMGLWYDSGLKEHEDNLMRVTNIFALEGCEKTTKFCEWLGEKYGWFWKEHFNEKEYAEFCS